MGGASSKGEKGTGQAADSGGSLVMPRSFKKWEKEKASGGPTGGLFGRESTTLFGRAKEGFVRGEKSEGEDQSRRY